MKVRDLIQMEIDIDVYDNVGDGFEIAFCGPLKLTADGEKKFADVLDYDVEIQNWMDGAVAVVDVDDEDYDVMERKLEEARSFFYSAAGYCSEENYKLWFDEEE